MIAAATLAQTGSILPLIMVIFIICLIFGGIIALINKLRKIKKELNEMIEDVKYDDSLHEHDLDLSDALQGPNCPYCDKTLNMIHCLTIGCDAIYSCPHCRKTISITSY